MNAPFDPKLLSEPTPEFTLSAHQDDIPSGDVLLNVEHVSLSFGGVKAIQDVSFDICKGEVRAIIGPNGAGKTSMLNVINGFYHPQTGEVIVQGVTGLPIFIGIMQFTTQAVIREVERRGVHPASGICEAAQ